MLLSFYLACFFACSDHILIEKVAIDSGEIEIPDIVVIPSAINFGHVRAGAEIAEQDVSIINAGDALLEIDDIGFYGNNGFRFTNPLSRDIEPGEIETFTVSYDPLTYESKYTYLYITSNDPDEPVTSIPVEGFGDAPVISVDPPYQYMGITEIGCEDIAPVGITNLGNVDLEINNLSLWVNTSSDFSEGWEQLLPIIIPIATSEIIDVYYAPIEPNIDSAILEIESNDPVDPVVYAEVDADADYLTYYTDTFEQAAVIKVDILFVVDNSGSMGVFQLELANNMNTFMSVFATMGADYQIAVITTDSPAFKGTGIVSSSDPDPIGSLSSIISNIGTFGSPTERGLLQAYTALLSGQASPGNAFFRQDSALVIVYVSDESDYTTYYSPNAWQTYANYYDTIKPAGMIIVHSVVGDYPAGCQWATPYGYSRTILFGDGYYDQVQYYGGNNYSICAPDWGQQMQSMAQHSVPLLSYLLTNENVVEETISVEVSGVQNTDWRYDPSKNSVDFEYSNAPDEGEEIKITYAVLGCTEEN